MPNQYQFSSVTQSCPTPCDPIDCSKPGFPVDHQLLELTQTYVHQVSNVIQSSHPLLSLSSALWRRLRGLCKLLDGRDSSVQSLSHVQLLATPWTAARQASLSITNSWNLLRLMFIESVLPSNHLILCHPLLLLLSIFPSIKVFSNESALRIRSPKYWRD